MQKEDMRAASLLSGILLSLAFLSAAQASESFAPRPKGMTREDYDKAVKFLQGRSATNVRSDLLVPDSPAFSVLAVAPETVVRPESPRDFAVSVLNGVDPEGNLQSGVAIDTAPYVLTGVDLIDYRLDPLERFLSRTQLSIATVKGSSANDESVRASVGLRFTLFDRGDPRMDRSLDEAFYRTIHAARDQERAKLTQLSDVLETLQNDIDKTQQELEQAQKEGNTTRVTELQDRIEAQQAHADEVKKAVDDEREELEDMTEKTLQEAWTATLKEHERGQWNATSAALGIAPVFFSEDGRYDDLAGQAYAIYGTLSYGFDHLGRSRAEHGAGRWLSRNAHLLLHARHTTNQKEAVEGSSEFREQDATVVGAQLRVRGPRIWSDQKGGDLAFALETDYVLKDFEGGGDDHTLRIIGLTEMKPFKNSGFTLKVAVGGESGGDQGDNAFVITTINWAFD